MVLINPEQEGIEDFMPFQRVLVRKWTLWLEFQLTTILLFSTLPIMSRGLSATYIMKWLCLDFIELVFGWYIFCEYIVICRAPN